MDRLSRIKAEILEALAHPEAEEGLYLENLGAVHEEEERKAVRGSEQEIITAVEELIEAGDVVTDDSGEKTVLFLGPRH